jgi:transketolase C-terminal domain/subunit
MAALALAQIADKGRTVTLRTETNSGTGYDPTISNSDASIKAVITKFTASEIDGTLIQANDKRLITTTEITAQQLIIDDGIEYEVINVDEIKPGDTAILYKAQIRK